MPIPNTFIEAGAGTGKTYRIMQLLCEGLKSGQFDIDNVAVITFTRKAAAELQDRVMQMLQKEAAGDDRIKAQLLNLGNAHISTIHSFCERLLKALPVEAEIDPSFQILEETEETSFYERVFNDWILMQLESAPEDLKLLCIEHKIPLLPQNYGYSHHDKSLHKMLQTYINHRELELFMPQPPKDTLDDIKKDFERKTGDLISQITEDANLKDIMNGLAYELMALEVGGNPLEYAKALAAAKPSIRSGKRIYDDIKKSFMAEIKDFTSKAQYIVMFPRIEKACSAFNRLANDLRRYYRDVMRIEGYMDFTEILIKTEELLRTHREAREYFKGKFKFIFVDEFQDTDPVQAHILFFLAERPGEFAERWEDVNLAENKICVVGDPKQSIYRFRRADIEIYEKIAGKIGDSGSFLLMNESYRSAEKILDWINGFFAGHFAHTQGNGFQVEYKPITIAPLNNRRKGGSPNRDLDGKGEVIFVQADLTQEPPEKKWSADEVREIEAKLTARWIQENADKYGGAQNILVLYRQYKNMQLTADYLEELGVPCELVGGKSFFGRQEVLDLNIFLKAVTDPMDCVSILAALRGPFFCLSDAQLVEWRLLDTDNHRFGYGDKLLDKAAKGHPVSEALRRLGELHNAPLKISAYDLLRREIDERKLLVSYRSTWHGRRRVMNIIKALEYLKTLDALPRRKTAEEFSAKIESQAEMADFSPHTGKDEAVQLMTIHRAKGLQKRVVYLADTVSVPFPPDGIYIDNDKGKLFYSPQWDGASGVTVDIPNLDTLHEKEKNMIAAEEGRLRYVAATRAVETLVINHHEIRIKKGNSIFRDLEQDCKSAVKVDIQGISQTYKFAVTPEKSTQDYSAQWEQLNHALKENISTLSKLSAKVVSPSAAAPEETDTELKVNVMYDPVEYTYKVEAYQAANVGSLVHKLLEIQPENELKTAASLIRQAGLKIKPEALLERYRKVKDKTETLCKGAKKILREVPIKFQDESNIYYDGIIDLLVEHHDGWLIIDYKILSAEYTTDQIAEKYKAQLAVYKKGLQKLGLNVKDTILMSP